MSKVWLITGTCRGFGRLLAEAVLEAGDRLVAAARRPAWLAPLAERYGDRIRIAGGDIGDAAQARETVRVAADGFGRIDVLVNNAGYGDVGSIEDTGIGEFRAQIEAELFGAITVTKAALPLMRQQRSGHIIQLSSIAARMGLPGRAAFAAAKWGLEGFSEVLAKEVAPLGIKVTIVEPGSFRTDFGAPPAVAGLARGISEHTGFQPGDPVKAAAVITYIAGLAEPPFRLLLGSDAVELARQCDRLRASADETWRDLSLFTDFAPPAGARSALPRTS
ncbi:MULTISPECIES: SDR family NAD(P)-dependent oxidoreductase [Rhodomicrobium]|uniref:SDR family NAD(P)-dependent oxidoreductase n=1 Tax=Rhodomicrobium TaxID=1068 RepID=UPI000B4A6E6B|nr:MULTISPECIES: SDR family NAD(P)-dependent oxidoreductase [Rhodomicrobium]